MVIIILVYALIAYGVFNEDYERSRAFMTKADQPPTILLIIDSFLWPISVGCMISASNPIENMFEGESND